MPFLEVEAYDPTTGVASLSSHTGAIDVGLLADAEALVVTRGATHVFESVRIVTNSARSLTLPRELGLVAGDTLLPSPGPRTEFGYLFSLKLDRSPSLAPPYEWRNFVQSGWRVGSYHGSACADVTTPTWTPCSLRDVVSPLATAAMVSGQAINAGSSTGGAVLRISHDSANHVIAAFGLDRSAVPGSGVVGTTLINLGPDQRTWLSVNAAGIIGRLALLGWAED